MKRDAGSRMQSKTVKFNVEKLSKAISDSKITGVKLSTMILGKGNTYVSEALRDGRCNADALKKLCEFLDLDYNDIVILDVEEIKPTDNTSNLDTLIIGLNQLYQIEKSNNELLVQILEQMKVSNAKVNRLENVIGQIHTNVIQIKEDEKELIGVEREAKSSIATISMRTKDIQQHINNKGGLVK